MRSCYRRSEQLWGRGLGYSALPTSSPLFTTMIAQSGRLKACLKTLHAPALLNTMCAQRFPLTFLALVFLPSMRAKSTATTLRLSTLITFAENFSFLGCAAVFVSILASKMMDIAASAFCFGLIGGIAIQLTLFQMPLSWR